MNFVQDFIRIYFARRCSGPMTKNPTPTLSPPPYRASCDVIFSSSICLGLAIARGTLSVIIYWSSRAITKSKACSKPIHSSLQKILTKVRGTENNALEHKLLKKKPETADPA